MFYKIKRKRLSKKLVKANNKYFSGKIEYNDWIDEITKLYQKLVDMDVYVAVKEKIKKCN